MEKDKVDFKRTENYQEKPTVLVTSTDKLLEERGKRYGAFNTHAQITQELKVVMSTREGWKNLNSAQREALEMIAHKIGRIINGDPYYSDSWKDIAGYAQLVVNDLEF